MPLLRLGVKGTHSEKGNAIYTAHAAAFCADLGRDAARDGSATLQPTAFEDAAGKLAGASHNHGPSRAAAELVSAVRAALSVYSAEVTAQA